MQYYDVKRFALVLAIQAEIEGMKAENTQRDQMNYSLAYTDADFQAKAEELRVLANLHDEQL
jgi:hypothetical protein